MPQIQINLTGWQGFRGKNTGSLLYVETSRMSVVPVRDQLNENEKGSFSEPNYETSTYGFVSCCNVKAINKIVKTNKSRYILFGTRYEGGDADYKDKYLIMGYMRIEHTKDVRSRHIQSYMATQGAVEPECMLLEEDIAVHGPMHFVSLQDSYVLTDDRLKEWGYKGHVGRQLKTVFGEEHTKEILAHLDSRDDKIDEYIATVEEFKKALAAQQAAAETDEESVSEEPEN